MPSPESNIAYIDSKQARMRRRLAAATALPLRSELEIIGNGLDRAKEAASQGSGTLIIWNHFSKRDGFDAARNIVGMPDWVNKPSVFPVSLHQKHPILTWLQRHAAYQYPYIVTSDTLEKKKFKNHDLNEGMGDFVKASRKALSRGGTVSIAFQGGRREYLDLEDKMVTLGKFLVSMTRAEVTNFGVLLVGLGDERITDYSRKRSKGYRLFKNTQVKIGPYFTLNELMANPDVKGSLRNVDPFIRRQFVDLVPEAYIKPPPRTSE